MTCSECYWNEKKLEALGRDYDNLKRSSINSIERVQDIYNELVEKNRRDIADYNELLRKYNSLVEKHNNSIDNSRGEYNRLVGEYNELLGKNRKNIEDHNILVNKYNTLLGESATSATNYKALQGKYNNLQILTNNKDSELEKKERKIRELKELLGKSREEIIDYKLKAKEGRLETLIQKLEVDRIQIRDLRKIYQRFIVVSGNNSQDEIDECDDKIEEIKDKLIDGGIDVVNARKFCQKCEKIAKLKAEQDNLYKERFEARQEVILYGKS